MVTDADPVGTLFAGLVWDTQSVSREKAWVMLAVSCTAVITNRLVFLYECPTRVASDVSDCQSVASLVVLAVRTELDKDDNANPPPFNVTEPDPVPPRFERWGKLANGASTDHTLLPLPNRLPAVMMTRRVLFPPKATLHLIDVSDSHSVPSHCVAVTETEEVNPEKPIILLP